MENDQLTGAYHTANHFARRARYYPVARAAHIERLVEMLPGDFLYSSTRADWLPEEAQRRADVIQLTFPRLLRRVWTHNYSLLEIPEPLAIVLLPRLAVLAIVIKLKRLTHRPRTRMVFYAIENHDQVAKVRSRAPLPPRLVSFTIRAAMSVVLSETARIAFGTNGAMENYRSQLGKRRWEQLSDTTEVQVIPGLSAATTDPPAKESTLACFVGSFEYRKGISSLIAAWPLVARIDSNFRLSIMGHGPLEAEVRRFAEHRADVMLEVDPPRQRLKQLMQRAHVLVLPSRRTPLWREQIGLPILEALSAGCEIVATAETGITEWLIQNDHTVIPEDASPADLASAIATALKRKRSADSIQQSLPSVDGRVSADHWLFR